MRFFKKLTTPGAMRRQDSGEERRDRLKPSCCLMKDVRRGIKINLLIIINIISDLTILIFIKQYKKEFN